MRIVLLALVGLSACESEPESCTDITKSPEPTIEIISDVGADGLPILHLENMLAGGGRGRLLLRISDHFALLYAALLVDGEEESFDYYEAQYPETVVSFGGFGPDRWDGKQALIGIKDLDSTFQIEQPIWIEHHSDYEN